MTDLDGKPIVIHGPNGAGKTNLLEALSLLTAGRGIRRAMAEDMAQRPGASGWKVTALLARFDALSEIETFWEGGSGRKVKIDGKSAPQSSLSRLSQIVWLVPAMDRLWVEGAEARRRFLDRMTLSFCPDHGDAVLIYDKAMRERNRLLKDGVNDPAWYCGLERQMADAAKIIVENRTFCVQALMQAQQGAQTSFPTVDLTIEHGLSSDDLAQALEEHRSRDMAAGRTLIGPHRADLQGIYAAKGVRAADCSTGEQKAMLVSMILANARGLYREGGMCPIVLLDEVAAHLDMDRQAALYDEICTMGVQAWMTGTGPEHFTPLGKRAAHFQMSDHGGIQPV